MNGHPQGMQQIMHLNPYLGYGLCFAWAFCFSSIYEFGAGPSLPFFSLSTASGGIACLFILLGTRRAPAIVRVLLRSPIAAILASVGTLLFTLSAPQDSYAHGMGMGIAGVCFVFVLVRWGELYAALPRRHAVTLAGFSGIITALVCYMVSLFNAETAALAISLLPLLAYGAQRGCSTGPVDPVDNLPPNSALDRTVLHALPWKTCLGLFAVFFARDVSVVAQTISTSWLGSATPLFLVGPCIIAVVMAIAARKQGDKSGLASLMRVLLMVVSAPVVLVAGAVELGGVAAFGSSVIVSELAWTVLVLTAGESTTPAALTIAAGWMAQMLGGMAAYLLAPLAHTNLIVYLFFALALLVLAGTALFPSGGTETSQMNEPPQAGTSMDTRPEPLDEFCAEHALSPRESEVFSLWVTGHGLRDIHTRLNISEATVKTHVRHLYEKCGVSDRPALIAAWEAWGKRRE